MRAIRLTGWEGFLAHSNTRVYIWFPSCIVFSWPLLGYLRSLDHAQSSSKYSCHVCRALIIRFESSASAILSMRLESFLLWRFLIIFFVFWEILSVSCLVTLPPTSVAFSVIIVARLQFVARTRRSSSVTKAEYLFLRDLLNSSTISVMAISFICSVYTTFFYCLLKPNLILDLNFLWSLHLILPCTFTSCMMPG